MKPRRESFASTPEADEEDEDLFEEGVFPRLRPVTRDAHESADRGSLRSSRALPSFVSPPPPQQSASATSGSPPHGLPQHPTSVRHASLQGGGERAGHTHAVPSPLTPFTLPSGGSSTGAAADGGEELWMSIERYLFAAYTVLHKGDETQLRSLKTPKQRMGWYAVVYNACSGNPAKSRELYARLALVVLQALEAFVLFPMLQQADRSRLVLITGQEGAVVGEASRGRSGARGRSGDRSREVATTSSTVKNGSFRFVRRLLFGDAAGHPRDASKGTKPPQGDNAHTPSAPSSARGGGGESGPPGSSPLLPHTTTAAAESGRETPPRWGSLSEVYFALLNGPSSPHGSMAASGGRGGASGLVRRQQSSVSGAQVLQLCSPSTAAVSQDTGRVVVDEEELLLPETSLTPPDSATTLPATPAPSVHLREKAAADPATCLAASAGQQQQQGMRAVHVAGGDSTHAGEDGERAQSIAPPANTRDNGQGVSADSSGSRMSHRPVLSACRTFCEEYATFGNFRRIVLSCFRYLDQYYTKRFGMDTLTTMCIKLFYVVVYEPVKPLLMDELFAKLTTLRAAHSRQHGAATGFAGQSTGSITSINNNDSNDAVGADSKIHVGQGGRLLAHTATSVGDEGARLLAAASAATSVDVGVDVDSDIRLIQQTLAVVTELIVAVQTTASYLVAGDTPATSGSTTTTAAGGGVAGGESRTAVALSSAAATAATAGTSSAGVGSRQSSPAAAGADRSHSLALDSSQAQSSSGGHAGPVPASGTTTSNSAPASVATTPRFRPFDLLIRRPSTPTTSSSRDVAPAAAPSLQQQQHQPPRESKRRRLMDIFKSSHHSSSASPSGAPSSAPVRTSPTQASPHVQPMDAVGGAAGAHAGDVLNADEHHPGSATSPISASSLERGGSEGPFAASDNGSDRAHALAQLPLVVDLRGTLEVRNRLESRSLALSLAHQAIRHAESHGGGGSGGGAQQHHQQQQQQQRSIGTIIREVGKPLTDLIGDDFGDKYMLMLGHYYRGERPHHTDAPREVRCGYVRWVRSVFALERSLLQHVTVPFIHTAVHGLLSTVLLVEVHRVIILDAEVGLRRLLDVWAGDCADDAFVIAVLGEDALREVDLHCSGTAASFAGVQASESMMTTQPGASLPSTSATSTSARAAALRPVSEASKACAVGLYYGTFAMPHEDSCCLLMASVLATKVIHDGADLISAYLRRVTHAVAASTAAMEADELGAESEDSWRADSHVRRSRRREAARDVHRPQQQGPTPSLEVLFGEAGDALAEGLVDVYSRYTKLIQMHIQGAPLLLGALSDAMAMVLNPSRWARSGAAAVAAGMSSLSSGGGGTAGGGEMDARGGSGGGMGRAQPPSVLLSRDAGAKATAPLTAILHAHPKIVNLSMPVLLSAYSGRLWCRYAGADLSPAMQTRVTHVAQMVSLFDDKDVFLEHYKEQLARRLLSATADVDTERAFVQQLQMRLGASSVHAFEAMLRDCLHAKSSMAAFENTDMFKRLPVSTVVKILSSAQWPSYRIIALKPHPTLLAAMNLFEGHYHRLHPSRTLRWVHLLGFARLMAEFPLGTKEITANTLQATILLHVSDAYNRVSERGAGTDGDNSARGPPADMERTRSRTASFATSDEDATPGPMAVGASAAAAGRVDGADNNDNENDDTARDMRTIPSNPSSGHDTSSPREASELADATPPTTHASSPPLATAQTGVSAPRIGSLLANLTSTALLTCRRAYSSAALSTEDKGQDEGDEGAMASGASTPDGGRRRDDAAKHGPGHLSGDELAHRMGLSFAELRPHLASVVALRGVPLLKCLNDRDTGGGAGAGSSTSTGGGPSLPGSATSRASGPRPLLPTDQFTLNEWFTHRLRKMQLPSPQRHRATVSFTTTTATAAAIDGDADADVAVAPFGGKASQLGSSCFDAGGASNAPTPFLSTSDRNMSHREHSGAPLTMDDVVFSLERCASEGSGGAVTRVPPSIQAMRRQQLDAAIVRVLKGHRAVSYYELVSLVTQQVARHFLPTARDIKMQLEGLVERDFISRSPSDENVFVYNA